MVDALLFNYYVVVGSGVSIVGAEEIYQGGVRGSCCHQALIFVCLVSESGFTAFSRKIYHIETRVLARVGLLVEGRVRVGEAWEGRIIYGGR